MTSLCRAGLLWAALAGVFSPCAATAQIANHVLIEWRDIRAKCGGAEQVDFAASTSVAVFEAVNAIEGGYTPMTSGLTAPAGSSAEAAAAQAAHDVLVVTCPQMKAGFADLLAQSLARVTDGTARANGMRVGQRAASLVLAARAGSRSEVRDSMVVPTRAGEYVYTDTLIGTNWAQLRPWALDRADQFRVPPPPPLTGESWARDLNEIQRLGGATSTARTAAQTESARYWGQNSTRTALRQLIGLPGRRLVDDARFLALADVAWSDSYISLFEGKYHYRVWRPVTAIRYADMDDNPATTPDRSWTPSLPTPMHPEYPCGHCVSVAAVGTVIALEFGASLPAIVIDQPGSWVQRYPTAQAYIDVVSESRLFAGAHPRFSLEVGKTSGAAVGRHVVERLFRRIPGARAAKP